MLDLLAAPAQMLPQANPDPKAHLDLPESLDLMDPPDNLVPLLLTSLCDLAHLVPPETPDPKAHPDLLESPAKMASLAHPDPKARKARPAHLAPMVSPVPRARPASPDLRARRVSARNTARSTVVCSSRTEPDDKRPMDVDFDGAHFRFQIVSFSLNFVFVVFDTIHKAKNR